MIRGVHPPSFQGQLISFHLRALDLFLQQETKKKGAGGENSTLTDGWWDSNVCPQDWIIKMFLAGETLNIFLLTGSSKINIFFMNKKMNVVAYINIHEKFASTNLTCNVTIQRFKKGPRASGGGINGTI